jgi:hypothetical protein
MDNKDSGAGASVPLPEPAKLYVMHAPHFENCYEEAALEAWRERKEAREKRKPRPIKQDNVHIQASIDMREAARIRIEKGYVFHGGAFGGEFLKPVSESGFRSDESVNCKLFVTCIAKGRNATGGMTKDKVSRGTYKVLASDWRYIALGKSFKGAIRIDIDGCFQSIEHLRFELQQIGLPFMPHLVVGDVDSRGMIIRPHLWILLPYKKAVWTDPADKRCRRQPWNLLRGVAAGITDMLLPIGADPGGLSNLFHGKNPLSPHWTLWELNTSEYPTLSEWIEMLPFSAPASVLARKAAAITSGLGLAKSNQVYERLRKDAWTTLRQWHLASTQDYLVALKSREVLGTMLYGELQDSAVQGEEEPRQALAVLSKVVRHAASEWDPEKVKRPRNAGKLGGQLDGMTLAQRQRAGKRETARIRNDATRSALIAAAEQMDLQGQELTKSGLARQAGVTRTTVSSHWTQVMSVLSRAP